MRNIIYAIAMAACLGVGLAAMYIDTGGFTPRELSQTHRDMSSGALRPYACIDFAFLKNLVGTQVTRILSYR